MMTAKRFKTLSIALLLGALAAPAHSQQASGDWQHTVFLYGMGAAIDGEAQIGNLSLPIDVSMSELFDALRFGAMAAYRMENDGPWSFEVDATYMNLGFNQNGPRERVRGELQTDQITLMGTAGYRISDNFEGLLSLVYFDVSSDIEVRAGQQRLRASDSDNWVDPMFGLLYRLPIGEKWTYQLRGDIGGFGVGSDLTWHMLTGFRRQNSDFFGWYVGYRVIAYDYESGSGRSYQRYDLTQQGPLAGVSFSF
jgi:hypothetical protein